MVTVRSMIRKVFSARALRVLKEFGVPGAGLILFFLFQAGGTLSEFALSCFIIGISSLLFFWSNRIDEIYLFGIGVGTGFFLEVGFRFLGYQQVWVEASLFGIPFWLPLAWGMGFVLVTRIGVFVRGINYKD